MRRARLVIWLARALWLLGPLALGPCLAGALDGRSNQVMITSLSLALASWTIGLVAVLVPTTASLTAVRLLTPAALGMALVSWVFGAPALATALGVSYGVALGAVVFGAELGRAFVQGSAYGSEQRFPLRPPGPLLLGPLELAWLLLFTATVAGPLLLASAEWVAGALVSAAAGGLLFVLVPRFHRLSLRWFVLVPTGTVLHDPLVLADTAMFPRRQVRGITLARADTEALDLTARALGPAIELTLRDTGMVVLAGTLGAPQGRGVHVRSVLFSPSRPGALLDAAGGQPG